MQKIKIVEISTYISLVILAIISFFMCLFKHQTPVYICSSLITLLLIYLIVHIYKNYEVDILGILLVIFGIFIIITQIIFLFAYNNMYWAQRFLWVSYYVIIEIIAFICNFSTTSPIDIFSDIYILNSAVSFLMIIYLVLYNLYIKDTYDE
jgi:hypothetical protein